MYEIRKKRQQELRGKWWFLYVLLISGIFLFSEGCRMMIKKSGAAYAALLLGIILHSASAGGLFERIFKRSPPKTANFILMILLFIIAAMCYFKKFDYIEIVLMDVFSISVYTAISFLNSKVSKDGQK